MILFGADVNPGGTSYLVRAVVHAGRAPFFLLFTNPLRGVEQPIRRMLSSMFDRAEYPPLRQVTSQRSMLFYQAQKRAQGTWAIFGFGGIFSVQQLTGPAKLELKPAINSVDVFCSDDRFGLELTLFHGSAGSGFPKGNLGLRNLMQGGQTRPKVCLLNP